MPVSFLRNRIGDKEYFTVYLAFNPNLSKMLTIPSEIVVEKNSIVEWVIYFNSYKNRTFYKKYGISFFRIYFEDTSPMSWNDQIFEFNNNSLDDDKAILATGEVTEEGIFKYGIEIVNPNFGQLYDEDPILKVIPKKNL